MHDVLCLGNALIDCFLTLQDPAEYSRNTNDGQELCVPLGEKVTVSDTTFALGGNACNIAVGLSRLGIKSALIAEIGTDEFSDMILRGLSQEQVVTEYVQHVEGPSSFAVGINVSGDRALFVEHVVRDHAFVFPQEPPKWLYINSLGNAWQPAYEKAMQYAKDHDVKIAFSPGTTQLHTGKDSYENVLQESTLVLCNKEEAQKMLGVQEEAIEALIDGILCLGPEISIITDGEAGSYGKRKGEELIHVPIVHAQLIERTGAGDAYATGFLGAYIYGNDIKAAMKWGTVNAASVVGKVGSQPGLLTAEELESKLHSI